MRAGVALLPEPELKETGTSGMMRWLNTVIPSEVSHVGQLDSTDPRTARGFRDLAERGERVHRADGDRGPNGTQLVSPPVADGPQAAAVVSGVPRASRIACAPMGLAAPEVALSRAEGGGLFLDFWQSRRRPCLLLRAR